MILDVFNHPDLFRLYEVLDAATGAVIDEPIFHADDARGFYRRYVTRGDGVAPGPLVFEGDPATGDPLWVEVSRPIRIAPRLERLCASLRASLAEAGVSADDIPEPVLGALALLCERLEPVERFVLMRRAASPAPSEDIEALGRAMREYRSRPPAITNAAPEDYWGHQVAGPPPPASGMIPEVKGGSADAG